MSSHEQELRDAPAKGALATVRKLLNAATDPNAPNTAGNTALHYAASVGDGRDEAVEALSTGLGQMKRSAGSNVTE